jgi:Ca2+-binding EF-hand superfamily protein
MLTLFLFFKEKRRKEMNVPVEDVLRLFDYTKKGVVATHDVPDIFECLGIGGGVLSGGVMENLVGIMDPKGTGVVAFSAFKSSLDDAKNFAGVNDRDKFNAFRLFDVQKRGSISKENLISVAHLSANVLSLQECQTVVEQLSGPRRKGIMRSDFKMAM